MAGKKGENSKKVAGNARKAEAAAQKAAAADARLEAEESENWQKGSKSNAKKEAEAAKKAEQAAKKAEKDALLKEEEASLGGRAEPKKSKAPAKKSRGLDLSQLDGGAPSTLNASGIDNALDALSLATGSDDAKIDKHPEKRFAAAYAKYEERRLTEMKADGSGVGLRLEQRKQRIRKEFDKSPENPFNQVTIAYNATRDDLDQVKAHEKSKIEKRLGPYAAAVLRFQISFPDTYPKLPPLILFSTDIFHPLITPLTTYMYAKDVQDKGTSSATDQERLPPGAFSLRHGFPQWFGRGQSAEPGSRLASGERLDSSGSDGTGAPPEGVVMSPEPSHASSPDYSQTCKPGMSVYTILKYIRSTFDTPEVLDMVPLEASGNPGAWHAWRAHRRKHGKLADQKPSSGDDSDSDGVRNSYSGKAEEPSLSPTTATRQPGQWNWDGVWEDRVQKGVAASLSEPVLYGGSGVPDEMIHFLAMEETDLESVKDDIRRTLGSAA
ncbi:Coiled-coil domain-containing protein 124 [Metarhizium brunneum]|uniref:Coiled-coil domain-containing protein 124 n=1 Tax=Metarhizium brunneum TaxID=500148 RepID=A0A7D5USP8_9HYPO|nr:Coiled-coil domain-containing protein 124 [Metarhizium brunneum]